MQRVTGLPPGMRMLGGCVAPPHWSTTPAGCLAAGTSRQRMAGPDAMHVARMPITCSSIGGGSSCIGTGAAAGPSGPLFTHSSPSPSTAAAAGRAAAGGGNPLGRPLAVRPAMALMLYRQQRRGLVSSSGQHSTVAAAAAAAPFVAPAVAEDIQDRELHVEASESYLAYAMSVIVGRALPDVRDGLKPVHRRLLYAMHDLGLSANKPFRKCARVVGEVLGKYHPHGDTAVYDALVRLAQDFSMRDPLIWGHGNFGSLDDDPAAAMRYTECRLRPFSSDALLGELHLGTVDWVPTFDAAQDEPVVLPAKVPMLLVNGSSGIAVGIATRIPPHNMREVVDGLVAMIKNPDITSQQLMKHIPAPDFPTGGTVIVSDATSEAYSTGKGYVTVRAKIHVEGDDGSTPAPAAKSKVKGSKPTLAAGRQQLVITEVPYQTSKAEIVQKIAELVEDKTLEGVSDVRDESDREGVRVVIELKKGVPPQRVLSKLLSATKLQSRFPCNMVALRGSSPETMGLREMIKHFLDFRCEVVVRRSQFQCSKAEQRLHLVEGYLTAMTHMDAVVQTIRSAMDGASAREALVSQFGLSTEQADGVLGLTLRRLTGLERSSLEDEKKTLTTQIAELQAIISDPARVLDVVEKEAREVADKHGTPRRSVIVHEKAGEADAKGTPAAEEVEPDIPERGNPCMLSLSSKGFLGRVMVPLGPRTKAKGKLLPAYREGDTPLCTVAAEDTDNVLMITSTGRAFMVKAGQVPDCGGKSAGASIASVLDKDANVPIVSLVPLTPDIRKAVAAAEAVAAAAAAEAAAAGAGAGAEGVEGAGAEGSSPSTSPSSAAAAEDAEAAAGAEAGAGEGAGEGGAGQAGAAEEEGEKPKAKRGRKPSVTGPGASVAGAGVAVTGGDSGYSLLVVSRSGIMHRVPLTARHLRINRAGVVLFKGKPSDPVAFATVCHTSDSVVLASSSGHVTMFEASAIGRSKQGMKLADGHSIASMSVLPAAAAAAAAPASDAEASPAASGTAASGTGESGTAAAKGKAGARGRPSAGASGSKAALKGAAAAADADVAAALGGVAGGVAVPDLMVFCASGKAKRIRVSDLKIQKPGGQGLQLIPPPKTSTPRAAAAVDAPPSETAETGETAETVETAAAGASGGTKRGRKSKAAASASSSGGESVGGDALAAALLVGPGEEVVVGTSVGQSVRLGVAQVPLKGRTLAAAKEVIALLNMSDAKGERVATVAVVPPAPAPAASG